jgi:phosphate acetyltransferase
VDPLERLFERARARRPRVVLPETGDERIAEAARRLKNQGIAEPVLPTQAEISSKAEKYAALYPGNPRIAERAVRRPLFFAGMMV